MDIGGLDYNTQRDRLLLPEYGREIQKMVDYTLTLPTKAERQRAAEAIIAVMKHMFPQGRNNESYEQKLWDHLALMSGFKLDIDYPVDVSQALVISKRPEGMVYPNEKNPVKHYGAILFQLFERLKEMPEGRDRDELVRLTINQMKRNLRHWSVAVASDEKVAEDLARFTDGKIQVDASSIQVGKSNDRDGFERRKRKK